MASTGDPADTYRTLKAPSWFEADKILGSRFLAHCAPALSPEAAKAVLEAVRAEHPDARHHCFAWRLAPPRAETRSSDGDEPAGSAGPPILRQIEAAGLYGLVVVVTRWFGGTKLGVGGLMRAYGGTAREALARAESLWVQARLRLSVELPYECQGALEGWAREFQVTTARAVYGASIQLELEIPLAVFESALRELIERTAGRLRVIE